MERTLINRLGFGHTCGARGELLIKNVRTFHCAEISQQFDRILRARGFVTHLKQGGKTGGLELTYWVKQWV